MLDQQISVCTSIKKPKEVKFGGAIEADRASAMGFKGNLDCWFNLFSNLILALITADHSQCAVTLRCVHVGAVSVLCLFVHLIAL